MSFKIARLCSYIVILVGAAELRAAELVSHYEFDGTGANEIGSAPDGELVDGASYDAGRFGQSLLLADGAWFDISSEGLPNADETLYEATVAFWVKWNSQDAPASVQFLGNLNAGDSTALLVGTNGAGGMQVFPRSASGTALVARDGGEGDVFNPDTSWTDGDWHHLAYAWQINEDRGIAQFYIDGDPLPEINYRQNNLTLVDEFTDWEFPVSIGARNNRGAPDMFVNANLDDFRVYDGFLEEDEVLTIVNREVGGLLGDFDSSGVLDAADIDLLSEAVRSNSTDARFDLNADGSVTALDRDVWIQDLRMTYTGDANLDGEFNSGDLVSAFTFGEYEDAIASNSTWASGDWNGDAEFDSSDFVASFSEGGYEQGPRAGVAASVPEPSTVALLFSLLPLTCGRRMSTRRFPGR